MARGRAKASNGSKPARGTRKRRGKSEDMTGAKDGAVEMRKAGSFDLQPMEIDDSDFELHFKAAKSAKETAEKYQSLYRGQLKQAKKVSQDLHDSVKLALSLDGKSDSDIKRDLEIKGYVLKRRAGSIQLTIHDTLLGDENQLAEKRGLDAALAGQTSANPYPTGSDLAALYAKGFKKGTIKNLPIDEEQKAKMLAELDEDGGLFPPDHNSVGDGAAATIQ